jgi:hypothetical protein
MEVLLVVVAADDDQRVAPPEPRTELGQPNRVEQQMLLAPDVLERVLGEGLHRAGQIRACFRHPVPDLLFGQERPRADHLAVPDDLVAVELDHVALGDLVEDLGPHAVDQRDLGADEHEGADVRIAPGDGRPGVDHAGNAVLDQALSGEEVEVVVVDDRHVAGVQTADEVLGPFVESCRPADASVEPAVALGRGRAPEQPERHACQRTAASRTSNAVLPGKREGSVSEERSLLAYRGGSGRPAAHPCVGDYVGTDLRAIAQPAPNAQLSLPVG